MPQKDLNTLPLVPSIGEYVKEQFESNTAFIASRIFQTKIRDTKTGDFPIVPIEAFNVTTDTKIGRKSTFPRSDWKYEAGQYKTEEHAFAETITPEDRALCEQDGIDPEDIASMRIFETLANSKEKAAADLLFNPAEMTNNNPVATEWSDLVNATIKDDIRAAALLIRERTKLPQRALSLIVNDTVFYNMQNSQKILENMKYNYVDPLNLQNLTAAQLAQYLGIGQIIVPDKQYNTAAGGKSVVFEDFWSKDYALLTYIDTSGDFKKPTVGYNFVWNKVSGPEVAVRYFWTDEPEGDNYVGKFNFGLTLLKYQDSTGAVKKNISASMSQLLTGVTV